MDKTGGSSSKKDKDKDIELDPIQDANAIHINITDESSKNKDKSVNNNNNNNANNANDNNNNTSSPNSPNTIAMFGVHRDAYESDSDYTTDDDEVPVVPAKNPFVKDEIWSYTPRSFGLFGYSNPIRKLAFKIVNHYTFEWLIFLLIIITAVFNALVANYEVSQALINANDIVGIIILVLFTIEAAMRMIAIGLIRDPYTYLRDPWNVFDLIVVVAGWIDVGTDDFDAVYVLRLLRVMRVIRIIRMVPNMRDLVHGIYTSIPTLAHTGGLFIIVFFVFAIVGVKLFNGSFRGRCYSATGEVVDDGRVCSLVSTYGYHCELELNETCRDYGNPNYGFTNFDNFGWGQLTVFQILTVEGWTDDLYFSQDGSIEGLTWIYFVLIIIIGSFLVLNLVTAVLCDNIGQSISVTPQLFTQNSITAVVEGDATKDATSDTSPNNDTNNASTSANNNNNDASINDDANAPASVPPTPTAHRRRSGFLRPEDTVRFITRPRSGSRSPSRTPSRRNSRSISFVSDNNALASSASASPAPSVPSSPTNARLSPATRRTLSPSSLSVPASPFPNIIVPEPTESPSVVTLLIPETDKEDENGEKAKSLSSRAATAIRRSRDYGKIEDSSDTVDDSTGTESSKAIGAVQDQDATSATSTPKPKKKKKRDPNATPGTPASAPPHSTPQQSGTPSQNPAEAAALLASMFSGVFADVYTNYFPETIKKRVSYVDDKIRPKVNKILFDFRFEVLVCLIVLAHTLVLATQHFGMAKGQKDAVFIVDRVFIGLFTLEVVMRIFGAGVKGYFRQTKVNWLDMIVLIGCWIEIGFVEGGLLRQGIYISVFRLFRVFELLRRSQVFANSAESIIACMRISANPFLLLLLFIYVYSMIGVSIFGDPSRFMDDDGHPRQNFDSFLEAALCVFQVLTGENWNNLLYTGMLHTYGAIPFFVSMYILGRYVLLAFFLAVMVDVYAETNPVILQRKLFGVLNKYKNQKLTKNFNKFVKKFKHAGGPTDTSGSSIIGIISALPTRVTGSMSGFFEARAEYSYWICPPEVRMKVDKVISHPYYQRFSMLIVIASCVVAALYLPHAKSPNYNKTLQRIELFFAIFFLLEVLVKGLAKNFIFGHTKYLQDIWNVLDFVVIVVSSITSYSTRYRFFVVFRAFRPLQLITAYKPVRIVLQALFFSLPSILPVFLIALLWWSMFAIFGVQLWSGSFQYCLQDDTLSKVECVGDYVDPDTNATTPYRWENPTYNFDNFGWGMLALFEISTLEGWLNVMYSAVDATDPGFPPSRGYRPAGALFFVVFIVGAVFFLLNLFVAVVTNQFFIIYEKESGLAFMDKKEREWKETKRNIKRLHAIVRPKPPESPEFMRKVHFVIFHKWFEYAMTFLVCLNMVVFMLEHLGMSNTWTTTISTLILVFSLIYVVELLLNLYFYGIKAFMRSNVRIFEGVVVVVSLIVIVVSYALPQSYFITFLTIFLILRVFRVVKLSRKLRILIATLWNSLLMNGAVMLVLCILLYIYAVIGIHFYADIVFGEFLNVHANFNNFAVACLTLFRMTTGENWNGIMHDCMVQEPDCSEAEGTCGTYWAILYYVSFQMIGTFIILPLFVAVILRQFQDETSAENFTVNPARLEEFRKTWQKFDPYGKQRINIADLYYFLAKLPKPLGIGKHKSTYYNQIIRKLSVKPNIKGQIQFQALLLNLAAIAMDINYSPKRKALVSTVSLNINKSNKKMDKIAKNFKYDNQQMWFLFAVIWIQRCWRARRRRRIFLSQLRNPASNGSLISEASKSSLKSSSSLRNVLGNAKEKIIPKSFSAKSLTSSPSNSAPSTPPSSPPLSRPVPSSSPAGSPQLSRPISPSPASAPSSPALSHSPPPPTTSTPSSPASRTNLSPTNPSPAPANLSPPPANLSPPPSPARTSSPSQSPPSPSPSPSSPSASSPSASSPSASSPSASPTPPRPSRKAPASSPPSISDDDKKTD